MPPRSYPTARQKRLGAELRKLRERAGVSGNDAAAYLGGERAQISHIESGRYGVSDQRVRRLAAHYSANDKHLVDALAAMAEERTKGWWDEYRGILSPGFLDLAELEHRATYIRSIQMLNIPGVFQTEAYARDLIRSGVTDLPTAELNARVEHRVRRRDIFDRPTPTPFEAFIHEAALRMRYSDTGTMRDQLGFLRTVSTWPSVTIRVIPFTEQITGSVHSMLYAGASIAALDTVQIDSAFDAGFLDAEAQLARYRELLGSVESISLSPKKSAQFIHRIAQEM
ncbi:helix-turn-helix domain-containing protein [Streptomyces sp. NBC_01020]|uniref:helix-turn-helix domain-containing protein n=1 Tax=unclassified Streptomyces TaxID=2593676 RepID=UPI002E21DF79|nr:helix-turn-helix domain-containing protein [Streptomyces sp. NBC_01020]WSX44016.1 helix-turn-helix domain-containing protein [Streptomyces sp. NBC_00963]WSX67968.1 helix-turn-helix domain-containing protein [Streptomyces sp. NBC_00932]